MESIIFHIDVNSAFLSWTALSLLEQGETTDLREIPAIIGGDIKKRHGVVLAKSTSAKKYGIQTGEPIVNAFKKCPSLMIAPPDHAMYRERSRKLMEYLSSICPEIEQVSIDECYMNFSPVAHLYPGYLEAAATIKDSIYEKFHFTVNIGISDKKVLAKMASDFEKPDKVHTLWESEIAEKMWPLSVRDLLWVGKKTEEKLRAYGIHTIGDLSKISVGSLTRLVGKKFALQLHEFSNGRDDSSVETEAQEAKSISAERTFPNDIGTEKDIDRALFNIACVVAHRLRRKKFSTSCISVFIKYKDFSVMQKQRQVSQPTDITAVILNEARKLVWEIWDAGSPVRQIGIGVSKLTHEDIVQMSLFEDPRMDFYREWDRKYDEDMAGKEDPRLMAYETIKGSNEEDL